MPCHAMPDQTSPYQSRPGQTGSGHISWLIFLPLAKSWAKHCVELCLVFVLFFTPKYTLTFLFLKIYDPWCKNNNQQPPSTWMTEILFLTFLLEITVHQISNCLIFISGEWNFCPTKLLLNAPAAVMRSRKLPVVMRSFMLCTKLKINKCISS